MPSRFFTLLVALAAISIGSVLAYHHPAGRIEALACFLFFAILAFRWSSLFLIAIPATLPIIGFAPWTGWMSFEELDILVLAMASGRYARRGIEGKQRENGHISAVLLILAGLMSISILISMMRGFTDAGGFIFGWFQGYDGPMNSVRIGKSFFLALLLIPLMRSPQGSDSPKNNNIRKLGWGIALGLGTASLAALWERLAFTDLLNFSSDYRSTALFWEMHVGGAALDGWLLLTFPFAIWAIRNAKSSLQYAFAIFLVGLAAYAALTTFSRGVYLALIVSLPLLAWLIRRQAQSDSKDQAPHRWGFFRWMTAVVLLGAMAGFVFPNGGYRGLVAILGVVAVSLSMPLVLRNIALARFISGAVLGLLSGALLVYLANALPKGPYVLYAALVALAFTALYGPKLVKEECRASICTATFFGLLLSAANVADYWGGTEALWGMCGAISILGAILIFGAFSRQPLWPTDLRWQGGLLTVAVASSAVMAVFLGGAYMGERFSTSNKDFEGRLEHWQQTTAMLQSPSEMVFGKGLGRFPANYYFATPNSAAPGTYGIIEDNGNARLSLVASNHSLSFGDILRISQRLSFDAQGPFEVALKIKAKADVEIHVEVCEKHLLYAGACAVGHVSVKATGGAWQPTQIRLEQQSLSGGAWYAPRFKVFSLGIGNQRGAAEIDDVELTTLGGSNLLVNGEFTNEMQHWFFSSDRDHMPWHAKNLLMNILFDQGIAGLAIFLLLNACALWTLGFGRAKQHELSPYLTAAIIGFLVVGMFDSLTDVPRLAFFYYLLLLYALTLGSQGKLSRKRQLPKAEPAHRVA